MKNLVFAFALLFGSMLCSCGGGHSTPAIEPAVDTIEVVTDTIPADTIVVDSIAVDTVAVVQ